MFNKIIILLIVLIFTIIPTKAFQKPIESEKQGPVPWNCTRQEAAKAFKQKILENPFPALPEDPYLNMTPQLKKQIEETISNKDLVCAIQYTDITTKKTYSIKQFSSKQEAENHGYTVTHQGNCNRCSTLQDLSIYLNTDLTIPIAKCTALGFVSKEQEIECLKKVGFTGPCAEIWFYNMQNTRRECYKPCMKMVIFKIPFVDPQGNLNACLQCDEDKSGPTFKYFSGRTRRNSGIESEIPRPQSQVYPMNQCYY